ncbi:TPA: YesL family protein [Streptococcus pyogenes]|uniref:YesL family protein n=1 Tax=Streptococcus pyogenes TaxID=1314 RepID=UPI000057BEA2|nr:YesL family protein [Streptococcus pyogenes]EQL81403.1 PF04854 family protein [Streptococcus pyogenes UTSW-2]ESA59051.1 PF04854 family protein [Streptococcus pyogenes GA40377]HER4570554.1 YesL family protein [Streptococcus pyogenes NGAS653]HER4653689.1 YesL family protein [Streptococcus pyogenes NGAS500]HER4670594.1 YesL family protein [Streptococcus pyogenes NGAS438]HER4724454.1 YesL family protein [Streptococcus pyogenes NGAS302]HER4731048.1 YesL family protein [Streptococcus pyogenes N
MNGIEKTCFLIWKMIQLTLIFHLLSLAGLIVFGVGPAWQTIVTLFLKTPQEENHYSLKRAVQLWKSYFKEANLRFGLFALTFLFLTFNLHWAVQFPSLFWFTVSFLIVIAMVWLTITYLYMVFYAVSYEINLWNNMKLAFISVFLSFKSFLLMLSVLLGITLMTWQYKGLYLFLTFGALVFCLDFVTKANRRLVDGVIDEC